VRIHPAIIAQAAATAAMLMPDRFFLGLGSGENLNEHILGHRWPPYDLREPMLEEAIEIIRKLWQGETLTYYGDFYDVEEARIYSLPESLPPIYLAAGGSQSAELAGEKGEGLISGSPDHEIVQAFRGAAQGEAQAIGKLTVCFADSQEEALETAYEWWPNAALPGELKYELRTPAHFEQAVQLVTKEDVEDSLTLGTEVGPFLEAVQRFEQAGFDRVYFHQVGPNQEAFIRFYEDSLKPALN
ncbi:MAG: TIGR03557 family F420-dependent LLM class oxidoreductase, partial [Anaerolineales bacterium]